MTTSLISRNLRKNEPSKETNPLSDRLMDASGRVWHVSCSRTRLLRWFAIWIDSRIHLRVCSLTQDRVYYLSLHLHVAQSSLFSDLASRMETFSSVHKIYYHFEKLLFALGRNAS